jgi:hypothetical protein
MTRAELMPLLNEVLWQAERVKACTDPDIVGAFVEEETVEFVRDILSPRANALLAALKKLEDVVLAPDEEC